MNDPSVTIRLDDHGRNHEPGEILSGEYRLESFPMGRIRAVELSVLWYTEGKGDEDMAVHEFVRLDADNGDWIDPSRPVRFEVALPNSPLSYDGSMLKIHWCARVRVFPRHGKEVFGQRNFILGNVRAANQVES
ncbi:MAG: hypothetical protein GX621_17815 [Pirellulaceae bacterium]|nr:hypothetical protein [Pirellulaceae bacterium]